MHVTAPAERPMVEPVATGPSLGTDSDEVAAIVGDVVIPESEVQRILKQRVRIPANLPDNPQVQLQIRVARSQILENMIDAQLLDAEVERAGVTLSEEELDRMIADEFAAYLASSGASRDELEAILLVERGQNIDAFLAQRRADPQALRAFRHRRWVEQQQPAVKEVTDDEVREHYQVNADKIFARPQRVRARQIFISTRGLDAAGAKEARTRAERILAEARQPGADFAALARQHSDDPLSKAIGGELGYLARGLPRVDPAVIDAALALPVGQVSDLIETDKGFHILMVTVRADAETIPFETVAPGLRHFLVQQKTQAELKRLAAELRQRTPVRYPPGKEPVQPRMPSEVAPTEP